MLAILHPDQICRLIQDLLYGKELTATRQEWNEFLENCDPNYQLQMQQIGFAKDRASRLFLRFIIEKNDVGLGLYIRHRVII